MVAMLALLFAPACQEEPEPNPDGLTARAYTQETCGALRTFADEVRPAQEAADSLADASDAQWEEALRTFLETTEDAAIDLVGRLREIGAPRVENGAEYHGLLIRLFDGIRSTVADTRAQLAGLTGDEFEQAASEMASRMAEVVADVEDETPPALERSWDAEPACQGL
jgi:hypothetical protein